MGRDDHERIVAVGRAGIYESNYLKANSRDGRRAVWIKHNLLRPFDGPARAELWAVLFERYRPPVVVRRDVPWGALQLAASELRFAAGEVRLDPRSAEGTIADVSWSLKLSRPQAPLHHFRHPSWYTAPLPKKKILTPAPNLHFDGQIAVGGEVWPVRDWVGLRGHNWGTEHAWSYAYGNCNLWDDGDPTRTVDGFSARVALGGRPSPWLSVLVGRNPLVRHHGVRHLGARCEVSPRHWSVRWGWPHRERVRLEMAAPAEHFVGLRYTHPDGSESCCYNTKFASVVYQARGASHTSRHGELELLFRDPVPGVALHPTPGWSQADGDYRSG